jgi:hypothetical protein
MRRFAQVTSLSMKGKIALGPHGVAGGHQLGEVVGADERRGGAAGPTNTGNACPPRSAASTTGYLEEAYTSKRDCDQGMEHLLRKLRESGGTVSRELGLTLFKDSNGNVYRWYCLPDTIDPREPKGK